LLIRTDLSGNVVYAATYGGLGNDAGKRFGIEYSPQPRTERYIIGTTRSTDGDVSGNHGQSDIWIVKIRAATGDGLW
jgi:hypothetical protein